jgi:hypothetical protein
MRTQSNAASREFVTTTERPEDSREISRIAAVVEKRCAHWQQRRFDDTFFLAGSLLTGNVHKIAALFKPSSRTSTANRFAVAQPKSVKSELPARSGTSIVAVYAKVF